MALVVQKYGGSSLESAERIRAVADRIVATKKAGNDVVVVCSAMGDTTDELLDLAASVNPVPPQRELDMLLTAGERISNALVAMAVDSLGAKAQSFTGSQAGVLTTEKHGNARITNVTPERLQESLDDGKICIVAGFQGVNKDTRDAKSIRMSTAFILPTRASCRMPASSSSCLSKKCWKWLRLVPRFWSCAASNMPAPTTSPCAYVRLIVTIPARWCPVQWRISQWKMQY